MKYKSVVTEAHLMTSCHVEERYITKTAVFNVFIITCIWVKAEVRNTRELIRQPYKHKVKHLANDFIVTVIINGSLTSLLQTQSVFFCCTHESVKTTLLCFSVAFHLTSYC